MNGFLASILSISALSFWGIVVLVAETLGILSACSALMRTRTSQGAIAWSLALITIPIISVPVYWVLGRSRFRGYVETLRAAVEDNKDAVERAQKAIAPHHGVFDRDHYPAEFALDRLTSRQFSHGNEIELLVDGAATFDAIFKAIDEARTYVLVQFFIIKDDGLGRKLKDALIAKCKQGVRVYVLYDEIGCVKLPKAYVADLRVAGAEVSAFRTRRGRANRFQINFRNHRKIVVTDGRVAFVGGHNVGDEYIDPAPRFKRWRDTHVRVEGPAVQGTQAVFLEDWYWATRQVPDLVWEPRRSDSDNVFLLPLETGPAHEIESCTLFIHQFIATAKDRLWVASPYFVPDEGIASALQLAALRGVDVRIMLPSNPDHKMVWLASFSYLEEMDAAGIKMFRYEGGFLHQKVAVVDDRLASIGTVNIDNRSFRLNFEISMIASDKNFTAKVAAMLEEDFAECRQIDSRDYTESPLPFRAAVRAARLFAPIL